MSCLLKRKEEAYFFAFPFSKYTFSVHNRPLPDEDSFKFAQVNTPSLGDLGDQGPRSKVQGPRSKVQGPRSKVQGPRSKVQGVVKSVSAKPGLVSPHSYIIHRNSYIIAPPNISRNESSSEYRISGFYRPLGDRRERRPVSPPGRTAAELLGKTTWSRASG
jgi:hypothetical protein